MKARFCIIFLTILGLTCSMTSNQERSLSGTIFYEGTSQGPVKVQLYKLHESPAGMVRRLSKRDIYGAKDPYKTLTLENPVSIILWAVPFHNQEAPVNCFDNI